MCRHLAYVGPEIPLGRLLTDPEHSLVRQSWEPRRQRYGTVNADGFGRRMVRRGLLGGRQIKI
ncbi:hypothetical protein SSAG_03172 [Streptomyces sp. Mg1]|nr:hypothetical protein SSAG_03172 [Streptomyces sp. Mg1]